MEYIEKALELYIARYLWVNVISDSEDSNVCLSNDSQEFDICIEIFECDSYFDPKKGTEAKVITIEKGQTHGDKLPIGHWKIVVYGILTPAIVENMSGNVLIKKFLSNLPEKEHRVLLGEGLFKVTTS